MYYVRGKTSRPSAQYSSSAKCIGLLSEDELTFDKKTVANIFHTFLLLTVAASLIGKLPNITGGYAGNFVNKYYQEKGAKQNSFKFSPVGDEDILKSLPSLNVSEATGLDGLSARFLKDGANQISSAIAHIINLSLYSGRIPDDMKTTRLFLFIRKIQCQNLEVTGLFLFKL